MSTPDPIAGSGAAAQDRARAEAALLAREAELSGTTGTATARLWISVADVRATRLGDLEGALKALELARTADPSSPAVLAALRRLSIRLWRWPLAADVLAAERRLLSGPERATRTLELAEIQADRLGRADEALVLFAEVLDGDPGDARALARAVPMWTAASAWTEMTEAMEAAADSVRALDVKRTSALFYAAGEVYRWRMHAPERAAEAYEKAIAADDTSAAAVKALAETASELRDWPRLAKALEREAELGGGGREVAAAALTKLGTLREDSLDDTDGAEAAWRAALEKDPAHRPALAALARVAERRGDHALLAELREKELLQATDVRLAVALSLALGQIYEERLGALDRAATQFQRVLAVTQTEAPAFRALGRLMAATGQWDLLIKLYEREATETTDEVHRLHCLFKIAEIYEEKVGDDRKAQEGYWRVLEISATFMPALRALGRIFQRREDWSSLVNLYLREAEAIGDQSHWLDVMGRVSVLQEEKLGALDAAARTWEIVLEKMPDYLPALRALARLHYRRGDWGALVAINLREATLTNDPQAVAALLHKTGEIYEDRLAVAEDAIRCYRRALDHVPNFLPAMRSLGRLAARRGAWKEVVETELLEAENVADARRAASLLNSAAEHYEYRLADVDSAIKAYERVLKTVPGYLPATAGLARLYRKTARWADLIRVLESSVPSLIRDPGGAVSVETEIATIEGHRLGNDAAAEKRITAARHMLPDDPHVRRELEEYLAKAGNWTELAVVYAEASAAVAPGVLRAGLQVRMGDLSWRSGVPDATKASAAFRSALIADPGNRAAASGLEDIALTTNDAKLQIEALTASSLAARTREERRAILVTLARLHEEAGEGQAAEGCWSAAAQIAPDVDSWEALARGARRAERHVAAADALSKAIGEASDPAEKERLTLEAANDLAEGGELEQAEAKLLDVASTAPEPTAALLSLERVYRDLGARTEPPEPAVMGKLADVLRRLAAITRDPQRRTELSVEAAKTLAGGLGRDGEAAQILEQVVESEPTGSPAQRDALTKLAEIAGATGDRARQASSFERLAEGATGIARAEYLTAAGKVLVEMDVDRAITCWERAVTADPTATAALDALIETYRSREAWQPLLTTWNRVIQATRDPKVAAQGYFEKGVLLLERMRLPDKAEQHFQRSLSALPTFSPALQRLAALLRDQKNIAGEREVLKRLVALEAPPELKSARLAALARACEELGDKAAALAALQEAAALAPSDATLWDRILALQSAGVAPSDRIAGLEQALGATDDESRKVGLRVALANALEEKGDDDAALVQAAAAVKVAPGDVEARAAVARILGKRKGSRGEAMDAHLAVLKLDPLRPESLAFLARAYEEAKQHDRVLCLSALVALAETGSDAEIFYREQMPRAPRESKTPLSFEDRLQLVAAPGAARGKTGELLARLDGAMFRGVPADLSRFGVTEAITQGQALFAALQGARLLFGVPEATAVLARGLPDPARVIPGDPPVIVLGPTLMAASDGVRRFLIGRAVFRFATGWYPAGRTAAELRNDLQLAAGALEVAAPPQGTDSKVLRAIVKAIPRARRKEIVDLLLAFVEKPDAFELEAFLTGADRSADRAGLLACVDLADAVTALALVVPEAGIATSPTDTRGQVLLRTAAGRDLLVFAASDDLVSLRKRAGLSIV